MLSEKKISEKKILEKNVVRPTDFQSSRSFQQLKIEPVAIIEKGSFSKIIKLSLSFLFRKMAKKLTNNNNNVSFYVLYKAFLHVDIENVVSSLILGVSMIL